MYGGDGITPDYCVEQETAPKFVAYLIGRQAFIGFARRFEGEEARGKAEIAGTGTRSHVASDKVRFVTKDFKADDAVLAEFKGYLDTRKLRYTQAELDENKVTVVRLIEDEVLRQAIGEGAARRRSMGWDPQIKKALELVPRADLLLQGPQDLRGRAHARAARGGRERRRLELAARDAERQQRSTTRKTGQRNCQVRTIREA